MSTAATSPEFVWSADEVRRVGYRAIDLIAEHLTQLPEQPVFRPMPGERAEALLAQSAPDAGESAGVLLDEFARDVAPYPFGNGHPRFYGWVNSPPAVIGIVGAALAAALNPSVAGGNHAAVWIERQVSEWLKSMFGFPPDAMGLLVSGGSAAALTALTVARAVACVRRGWNVRADGIPHALDGRPVRLLLYQTSEAHACHQKAAELLGIGSVNIRIVPTDAALRMRVDALAAMLDEDLAAGHVPVAVIGNAGTVNTGAVDRIASLADICTARGVWLHVDGAYGAPAILTEEFRGDLAALSHADSVAVDPHKWLYVPVDAGVVLVRDAQAMRDTFSLVPAYLRTDGNAQGVQGPPWLSEYGMEQTRPFRGLKIWMTLRHFGLDGLRAMISRDIALARHFARRVRATAGLELWEPQGLSVVCFRAVPSRIREDGSALDALNLQALHDLQLGGAAFLSSTVLAGRVWLRACIVNPRATEHDIDAVLAATLDSITRVERS